MGFKSSVGPDPTPGGGGTGGQTGGGENPTDDCNYYGTCDNSDEQGEIQLQNLMNSIVASNKLIEETTGPSGSEEREKSYKWIFAKGVGLISLVFTSHESGVHKRINREWRWKSLTHDFITRDGTVVGGVLDLVINKADTYCGDYNAGVNLNFTVTGSVIARGAPLSSNKTLTSYKTFHINNDYASE